jgi:hypothetical protein
MPSFLTIADGAQMGGGRRPCWSETTTTAASEPRKALSQVGPSDCRLRAHRGGEHRGGGPSFSSGATPSRSFGDGRLAAG